MPNAEIVLVNDGSIDKSPSIAKALSHEFENIKLFSTNKNIGKGGAIKLGFENLEVLTLEYLMQIWNILLKT